MGPAEVPVGVAPEWVAILSLFFTLVGWGGKVALDLYFKYRREHRRLSTSERDHEADIGILKARQELRQQQDNYLLGHYRATLEQRMAEYAAEKAALLEQFAAEKASMHEEFAEKAEEFRKEAAELREEFTELRDGHANCRAELLKVKARAELQAERIATLVHDNGDLRKRLAAFESRGHGLSTLDSDGGG